LLIVLMLVEARVLQQPLLYLSLFFKQHRSRYYELLDGVRQHGDWEAWVAFFLEGVATTAAAAVSGVQGLLELFRQDQARLSGLGRRSATVLQAYLALQRRPLTSIGQLKTLSGLSFPTASKAIETLCELGIAREITGARRNRLFVYSAYLSVLSEGTEPL
jgi:Fic family protein